MIIRISLLVAAILLVSGCAPKAMYEWGGYEKGLYKYYKNPDALEKYVEILEELVAKGQRDDRVPPGLYAEYGYALNLMDHRSEAVSYFELEKKAWPESTHLMDIMIKSGSPGSQDKASLQDNAEAVK